MRSYKVQFTDRKVGYDVVFIRFFARRDAVVRLLSELVRRGEYAAVFKEGRDITAQLLH